MLKKACCTVVSLLPLVLPAFVSSWGEHTLIYKIQDLLLDVIAEKRTSWSVSSEGPVCYLPLAYSVGQKVVVT